MVVCRTIGCGDHNIVLTVGQAHDLHDGHLVQSIGIVTIGHDPLAILIFVAIVGIDNNGLDLVAIVIGYPDRNSAGGVAGQTNHIETSAIETEGCSSKGSSIHMDHHCTTQRVLCKVGVCAIVTIVIVSIQDAFDVTFAGTVGILSAINGGADLIPNTGCNRGIISQGFERGLFAARLITIGQEAILIIDRGCGDHSDLRVQIALLRRGILIIFYKGLIVEDHRSREDHIALLKADLCMIALDGNGVAVDSQRSIIKLEVGGNTAVHGSIAITRIAACDARDRVVGDQVILSDIDQHIQAEVHDHGILSQRRLPNDSESDGGIVEVEVVTQHGLIRVITRLLGGIHAVIGILGTGLGVVNLGGVHAGGGQILSAQAGLQGIEDVILGAAGDQELVEDGCTGMVTVDMQLELGILIVNLVVRGQQFGCQPINVNLAVRSDMAICILVPNSGLGIDFGNEGSVGEVDHLACLVDGLTGSIDQIEHIGNLCAGPGLLRNGHGLQAVLTLEVGVGQVCKIVGLISAGFNFIVGTDFRSGILQIQEVAQCIFCSIQLFYGPVQHAGSGIVNEVGSCNDHILGHVGVFVHGTADVCAGGHVEPLVCDIILIGGLDAVGDEVVAIVANRSLRSIAAIGSPVVDGAHLTQGGIGKDRGFIGGTIAILGSGQSTILVLQVQLDNRSLLSGTLVISVQGVLQELNVEFLIFVQSFDFLGAGGDIEDHGVLIIDLVFHLDVGSSLQDLCCDIGEDLLHLSTCVSVINGEEVFVLLAQGSGANLIGLFALVSGTGNIVKQSRGQVAALGSSTGPSIVLIEQADTDTINSHASLLHLGGVVLVLVVGITGSIVATAGQHTSNAVSAGMVVMTSSVDILIGSGHAVGHEDGKLLTIVANTIGLCGFQDIVSLAQTIIIGSTAGGAKVCPNTIQFTLCIVGTKFGTASTNLTDQVLQLCIGINGSKLVQSSCAIRIKDINTDTVLVVRAVLVDDDRLNKCLRCSNGSINTGISGGLAVTVAHIVHGAGHIQNQNHINLVILGIRNAGHGQLDLSDTGFGEVTHSGSGLIEADSAFVGVLGEVVGAITGGGMLRGGNVEVDTGGIALAILCCVGCGHIETALFTGQGHNAVGSNSSNAVVLRGDVPGHSARDRVGTCAGDLIDQCAQIDRLVFLNALNRNGGVGDILAVLLNGHLVVRSSGDDFDIVGSGLARTGRSIADLDQRLTVCAGEGNLAGIGDVENVGIAIQLVRNSCILLHRGSTAIGGEGHGAAQIQSATSGNDLLDLSLLASEGDCICAISRSSNRTCFIEVDVALRSTQTPGRAALQVSARD